MSCNFTEATNPTEYLQCKQFELAVQKFPTFVLLILCFLLGFAGNPLIILIFSRQKKATTTSFFIVAIAVVDFMATLVTLPVTFYVNFRSMLMNITFICKLYFFTNMFNGTVSAFLLLAVAFVRYRKICFPFGWQVLKPQARSMIIFIVLAALLINVPHVIVHGRQKRETDFPGVYTYHCNVDDAFLGTIWPIVYTISVNSIFLCCCFGFIYMYVRIGLQARRHRKNKHKTLHRKNKKCATEESVPKQEIKYTSSEQALLQNRNTDIVKLEMSTVVTDPCMTFSLTQTSEKQISRTTVMLFTISVVYVVTNFTTTMLMFTRAMANNYINSLKPVPGALYSFFFNIFLINCAVNPVMYSLCNRKFRQEGWKILTNKK